VNMTQGFQEVRSLDGRAHIVTVVLHGRRPAGGNCRCGYAGPDQRNWPGHRQSARGGSCSSRAAAGALCDPRAAPRDEAEDQGPPRTSGAADLKFLRHLQQTRSGTSIEKRHSNHKLASVLAIPKFVPSRPRGLTNFGIGAPDCSTRRSSVSGARSPRPVSCLLRSCLRSS
jgi:hypothetical protein